MFLGGGSWPDWFRLWQLRQQEPTIPVQDFRSPVVFMPEVRFQLQWPDGQFSTLYSPSTVMLEYLKPGDSFRVSELESLGVKALRAASDRVRARYGFACTRTDEEESQLRRWTSRYKPEENVRVISQLP